MTPINQPLSPLMSRPRVTASDRLEADKAKYVKSPQVIHRRQNPAIGPFLSPVLARKQSPSLCSAGSPTEFSSSSDYDFTSQFGSTKCGITSQQNNFNDCLHQAAHKSGLQSPVQTLKPATIFSLSGNVPPNTRKQENNAEAYKENTLSPSRKQAMSHSFLTPSQGNDPQPPPNCSIVSPLCRKRFSGKRLNRPDSLIMYRQKREESSKENENVEAGLVIRFLQGTPLLRRSARFSQNKPQACTRDVPVSPKLQKSREEPVICQTNCTSVPETQEVTVNDNLILADAQKFFESCGLEGSLLNLLDMYQNGDEHTPFGSMESMDRVSCGFAAASEEEKAEKTPVSIIERNARVIKWIYSCQQARTHGSHEHKQSPRESTV